ncbi:uncharacterized protein K452DRAFT_299319 [Aplosporella prunicola CBS 121167]|uniref:Uncharacterized protein n=1 Tax=Aplosporella prunicola CBS 121167 TaxID=1176127 RepID=A0A6A6BBG2_9PEZI|nr:uncharacterized protein K452DRAFT_299319 [Aplosporella prunicola CBS 121167]KAF2140575.1 hypothetical protein K452DRAFT_299319 [Aplosporella prunicola CBS 121167]
MTSPTTNPPRAILFDIGGVVVQSPFQAILDYERAHGIPAGWINTAISRAAPAGAWQRLERGEMALDEAFFAAWAKDLSDPVVWREFWLARRGKERNNNHNSSSSSSSSNHNKNDASVPPHIHTPTLFWSMMRLSRHPDPHMYPALRRLHVLAPSRGLVLGALSNTVIFPAGVRDETGTPFDSGLRFERHHHHQQQQGGTESAVLVREENAAERSEASEHSEPSASSTTSTAPHDIRALLPVQISSAHSGLRKPDAAIYALALRALNAEAARRGLPALSAHDVLFLDDIGQNLRGARAAGMRTLKVELGGTARAVRALEGMLGVRLGDEMGEEGGRAKL